MNLTADVLGYLHDARLLEIKVDFSTAIRTFMFVATYDDDCELEAMNGQTIEVSAEDVTIVRSTLHGAHFYPETIDSLTLTVSEDKIEQLTPALKIGMRLPKAGFSLLTHTGSYWEVMYETLSLRLRPLA